MGIRLMPDILYPLIYWPVGIAFAGDGRSGKSLQQLLLFRILQGMGGGGVAPVAQSILADTFPPGEARPGLRAVRVAVLVARLESAQRSAAGPRITFLALVLPDQRPHRLDDDGANRPDPA
jgi:MFS family permease